MPLYRISVKILLTLLCIFTTVTNAHAQKTEPTALQRTLHKVKDYLDKKALNRVDTNYLALPEYGWKASVTANFAGVSTSVKGNDIPTYEDIDVDMHSSLNGHTSLMLGYRSLSASYSWDIAHGYSRDFNLAWFGKQVGLEFRSHTTDGLHGVLDASATEGNVPVNRGDTRLKATIINGYYVFNYKKYSLPAAMKQSLIQKRSQGSVTAYAAFLAARMESKNPTLSTMLSGITKIEFYQAAVGVGYGYNYTPNRGRLLMHFSAAPLLVFFNKSFITANVGIPLPDGSQYATDISKEVHTKNKFFVTGVARASMHYNINRHFYLGAAALVNDIRFKSESGVSIRMEDWIVNASLGVRF